MEPDKKVVIAALGVALVVGVGLAVDSASKDDAPPEDKKLEVREFKREDGSKFFGYYADEKRRDTVVEAPPQCVIPDCQGGDGPVDCLRQQPTDNRPKWKGCNVMPASEASGSQCVPTGCWKYFGEEEEAAK